MSQEDRFYARPKPQRPGYDANWCRATEAWVRLTAALLALIALTLAWHDQWPAWFWKATGMIR